MTITMQVTESQALALQAMFAHWNTLSSMGSSRNVAFMVDGDGNFHPKCLVSYSKNISKLTDELKEAAVSNDDGNGNVTFDYDGIAWRLMDREL